jgi:hypothetical protein
MVEMKWDLENMTGQREQVSQLLKRYVEKFGDMKDEKGMETASPPA